MSDTNNTVKVGKKQKHLTIPPNYKQVTTGTAQPGDMFANLMTLRWQTVEEDDINMDADTFDALIRSTSY